MISRLLACSVEAVLLISTLRHSSPNLRIPSLLLKMYFGYAITTLLEFISPFTPLEPHEYSQNPRRGLRTVRKQDNSYAQVSQERRYITSCEKRKAVESETGQESTNKSPFSLLNIDV